MNELQTAFGMRWPAADLRPDAVVLSSASMVRGRLAPSPTGRLHLGNARTALLAWLQVRRAGGELILRIEDVDRQRCRPEFESELISDLRWLGLDWDEGPDVGGGSGPYRQSERETSYERALEGLESYACSCTRRELAQARARGDGAGVIYPGYCRDGVRNPERPTAQRWRVPDRRIAWDDPCLGRVEQDLRADVGDIVLRRRDGFWAYTLAVVVDDAAMGITHVLRGADLLSATPVQIALHHSLGHEAPDFLHVPLVRTAGVKLSKRRSAPSIAGLRQAGVEPEQVLSALAESLGLATNSSSDRLRPQDLVAKFEPRALPREDGPVDDRLWSSARSGAG